MLSCPTESASPKLTFGRGENPSVNASGSSSMRNARSNATGDVAVRDEPHLAALGEAHPHREPVGASHDVTLTGLRMSSTRTSLPKPRPWPVPWLPPAGGTADATTCSSA